MMNPTRSFAFGKNREDGFTFVELLVVLATVGILAVLLLPAMAGTKPSSQAFQCLENQRQLTLGWLMYAEDNSGKLTPNCELGEQPTTLNDPPFLPGGKYVQWCPGNMKSTSISLLLYQTNFIQEGLIYPYVNNINVYKCPADLSVIKFGTVSFPRLRSYSMNCWLSPYPGKDWYSIYPSGSPARIFNKETDITAPKPAMTFVFMEENANSIDDGYFAGSPGLPNEWINVPSTRHGNAGALSYADGHSEIRRWTDGVILSQNAPNYIIGGVTFASDPNSGDNAWLEQRESSVLP
jgi:prepilin-type N-terminal cleavage/methylation domain-containing protein/prepilin-type processing-associated H-X9-DG protein